MTARKLKLGDLVYSNGKLLKIRAFLDHSTIQVQDRVSGEFSTIHPGSIEKSIDEALLNTEYVEHVTVEGFPESEAKLAMQRFDKLITLTDKNGKLNVAPEIACEKLELSRAQMFRLLAHFDPEAGFIPLIRNRRGRKTGSISFSTQVESIISEAIEKVYKGPGASHKAVINKVETMCFNAGFKCPSDGAISRRIRKINPRSLSAAKYGAKTAAQNNAVRGQKKMVPKPLDLVQMDHTRVDVFVVDEKTRQPLTRPWLTLAIDLHTRVVLGFYLSLDAPSSNSIALCICHAMLPKNIWLNSLNITDFDYPYYGLIKTLAIDNGSDFHSSAFIKGCMRYNIKPLFRPPGATHYGGHIERLNGTLMKEARLLPGTTTGSVRDLNLYNNIAPPAMTFTELRLWLAETINIYHKTEHSGLNESPLCRWERAYRAADGTITMPELIDDPKSLLLDFMPYETRHLNRAGIKIHGVVYYSPALQKYNQGQKFVVKYDPSSMRRIWVRLEDCATYIELTYADVSLADISLSEYRMLKKEMRVASGRRPEPGEIHRARERRESQISESKKATKAASKAARLLAEKTNVNTNEPLRRDLLGAPAPRSTPSELVEYDSPPKIYDIDVEV